jgi:hypothetical protein
MNNEKELISKFLTILLRHYDDFVKFDIIIGPDGRYHVRIHVSLYLSEPERPNEVNQFSNPDLITQTPRNKVGYKKTLQRIKNTFNLSDDQIKLMLIVQTHHIYEP